MTEQLRAVGGDIFAGGFTVGVSRHFDVLAHFEENNYGVMSTKLNFPSMPVFVGVDRNWKRGIDYIRRYHRHVNFVYTNPPCAIFSVAGATMKWGNDGWRKDPRQSCWRNCFTLLEHFKPDFYVTESVVRAFTAGREFVDGFSERAQELGYSTTHLLIDARWLGVPQRRRRYFMMFHKYKVSWQSPNWAPSKTVFEALQEVDHPGASTELKYEEQRRLLKQLKPGENLRKKWEEVNPPETWVQSSFGVEGRPRMFLHRLNGDITMGTMTGDYFIHPTEDRLLGGREIRHLCGFPMDYRLEGKHLYHGSLLARGVMPPVGEWLAKHVKNAIEHGIPTSRETFIVDLRDPPKFHSTEGMGFAQIAS